MRIFPEKMVDVTTVAPKKYNRNSVWNKTFEDDDSPPERVLYANPAVPAPELA